MPGENNSGSELPRYEDKLITLRFEWGQIALNTAYFLTGVINVSYPFEEGRRGNGL